MEKTVLRVDGMSCEHCVKAVTAALHALPGIISVTVSLADKTVTAEHDAALPLCKIKQEIEEQGYEIIE